MTEVSEFYDDFAKIQEQAGINHRHLSIQRWVEYFGIKKHHKILEIGCGIGTQTELLLRYLSEDAPLLAIDISNKNIEIAKKRLSKYSNAEFHVGDIVQMELSGSYDAIIMPDVIEHIPLEQHQSLFSKIDKLLTISGLVLIHIPSPYYLEWLKENKPEQLQIIDQPIHTEILLKNIEHTGLYLDYLQTYSIYNTPEDYQLIVLRKKNFTNFSAIEQPKTDSFLRRLKRKLAYYVRGGR